jgi:Ca2+-binding EF-hand superfamily protein
MICTRGKKKVYLGCCFILINVVVEKVNVPNLIENNTLSERFVEILQEVFAFFDQNKDGALSPTELDAFTRFAL